MRPDHREFADGVKLAAIAVVSAIVTATVVIGAGRTLTPQDRAAAAEPPALTRVGLRQAVPAGRRAGPPETAGLASGPSD